MKKMPSLCVRGALLLALLGMTRTVSATKPMLVLPDPTPYGPYKYINPNPPEFHAPEYPGQSYDALVPATLDLAERAKLALNALTEMVNPNMDYEYYTMVNHLEDPP